MSNNQDNSEKRKNDSISDSGDNSALSSERETDKKKVKIPKFEEKDMYKIKYNF
jgi:hypothetical protein